MGYATNLEARLARKVTKAIGEFDLVEDGTASWWGCRGAKIAGR